MSSFDEFFARRLEPAPEHLAALALEIRDEIRKTATAYLAMVELEAEPVVTTDAERDAFRAGVEAGLLATMSTFRRRKMLRGDTGQVLP